MLTKRLAVLFTAAAALIAALTVAARATPASGSTSTLIGRAAFVDPVDLKIKIDVADQQVIHVPNALDTVVQTTVLLPGGQTGWHSHWGPAVVLVTSGALTLYSAEDPTCTGTTYVQGQAFVDRGQGHVHIGVNQGGANTTLATTFFDVPPGQSPRVDAANPGTCAF